ncbi:MAG: electron transfer flavoprotein subunit alpha/FixB family protein, partial [Bacteroidota bacterium]
MAVLIFADTNNGKVAKASLEAVAYGSHIAQQLGTSATVITYGAADAASLAGLGNYGAAKVLHCDSLNTMDPLLLARLVEAAAAETGASTIIFSHDYTGKSLAPLVAARWKAGLVSGAIDYPDTEGGMTVEKAVFSGKAF